MIRPLSTRERKILALSLAVALAYIGYIFVLKPAREKFAALDEEIAVAQRRLDKSTAEIRKAASLENVLGVYERKFKQPASKEGTMSSILSEIEDVAAQLHVQIANLTPKRVRETELYNRFSVSLTIDGNFMDILQFLHTLQNEPHLFYIEEIRFDKGTRQQSSAVKTSLVLGKSFIP